MGFMETSLMRQLGKLVEVVRHANEVLGDGYRLCVVSADHLAVQGGLTDVLRQLAVGFSRPQSQCLVAWLENFTVTDFDSLRTLPVGGLPPFLLSCSCMFVIRYTVYSWYTHFLRPSGAKFSALMVERGVLGFPKHNLAPSQNTLVGTTAFQLSTSKVADLNSHNLRQASKSSS